MLKRIFLLCIAVLMGLGSLAFFNTAQALEKSSQQKVDDLAVVYMREDTPISIYKQVVKEVGQSGGRIYHVYPYRNIMMGNIPRYFEKPLIENFQSIDFITREQLQTEESEDKRIASMFGNRFLANSRREAVLDMDREPVVNTLPVFQPRAVELVEPQESRLQDQDINQVFSASGGTCISDYGLAYGADVTDYGNFLAGEIVTGVFFMNSLSDYGTSLWSDQDRDTAMADIQAGLNQFILDQLNAPITFYYEDERATAYPASEDLYVANLRKDHCTHWSYITKVFHVDGTATGSAYYLGNSIELFKNHMQDGGAPRHETGHIFGMRDNYTSALESAIKIWGYLGVVNANSRYNDGLGYNGGQGEGRNDLMVGAIGIDNPIRAYSSGQAGWHDSDGDGILDTMDTYPDTTITACEVVSGQIHCTGQSADQAVKRYPKLKIGKHDVTINYIEKIQYSVNSSEEDGGPWYDLPAADSLYDYGLETFDFTTPAVLDGEYTIRVRGINSVGNIEISSAIEKVTVSGSSTSDNLPWAYFDVSLDKGSEGSVFEVDAGGSKDDEDAIQNLQFRWNFDDGNGWTSYSSATTDSVSYTISSASEIKNIQLEVKDTSNNVSNYSRTVTVFEDNLGPEINLTVSPQNAHGPGRTFFTVTADATGTFDPEDDSIEYRWDYDFNEFENPETWDTGFSSNSQIQINYYVLNHPYTDNYRIRVEAKDSQGNSTFAVRDVWSNGYNEVPSYSAVEANGRESRINSFDFWGNNMQIVGDTAYVVTDGYFNTYDVSDYRDVVLLDSYAMPSNTRDLEVIGNIAYVADWLGGVSTFDVSDAEDIQLMDNVTWSGLAYRIDVDGDYAYISDHNVGIRIADVSDPYNLTLTGYLGSPESYMRGIAAYGDYVYLGSSVEGLYILDVSNRSNPTLVTNIDTACDEIDGISIQSDNLFFISKTCGLRIYDLTNPESPSLLGTYSYTGLEPTDVYVDGDRAYLIADTKIHELDISSLNSPTSIKDYDLDYEGIRIFKEGTVYYILGPGSSEKFMIFDTRITEQDYDILLSDFTGADANINNTWDQYLAYRFDVEGDKVWDTPYMITLDSTAPSVAPTYRFTPPTEDFEVVAEVRDRFSATDQAIEQFHYPAFTTNFLDKVVIINQQLSKTFIVSDEDSDPIIFAAAMTDGAPISSIGATFTDNGNGTASLTWTPTTNQIGDYYVRVAAFDGTLKTEGVLKIQVVTSGYSCFLEDTMITMADGSRKAIQDIEVGDRVLSYDVRANKAARGRVDYVFTGLTNRAYFTINGRIKVTAEHLFLTDQGWKKVRELSVGDKMRRPNGTLETVRNIVVTRQPVDVYNFSVNRFNNYVADGVVVHNKNPEEEPLDP